MTGKMTPEKARELRDEVVKGHVRQRPSPFLPQPGMQKHRRLRFDRSRPEQVAKARELLSGLEGLHVEDGQTPYCLAIWYEVCSFTLEGLETALRKQGFMLEEGIGWKLVRAVIYYAEETQLRNMRCPERLLKKSHEVYSRAWDQHKHGDHDDTPPDLRREH